MNMQQFVDYKQTIANNIRQSQSILDLVFDEYQVIPDEDKVEKHIHTYNFSPLIETEASVHIFVDTIISDVKDDSICGVAITFWIAMPQSLIDIKNIPSIKGDRRDNICIEIDKIMNGKHMGIGKIRLSKHKPMSYFYFQNYVGKEIVYEATDFNNNTSICKLVKI